MNFTKWYQENNGSVIVIPINKLYGWQPKVQETVQDIKQKQLSYSSSQPVIVSRLDNPRGGFYIIDGYHRVIEAMLAGQNSIQGVVDQHIPRIERTGGAHSNHINNKIPIMKALGMFD